MFKIHNNVHLMLYDEESPKGGDILKMGGGQDLTIASS